MGEMPYFCIAADFTDPQITFIQKGGKPDSELISGMAVRKICLDRGDALYDELKSFVRAIKAGTSPEVTGEMGRDALAVALDVSAQIEAMGGKLFA